MNPYLSVFNIAITTLEQSNEIPLTKEERNALIRVIMNFFEFDEETLSALSDGYLIDWHRRAVVENAENQVSPSDLIDRQNELNEEQ